MLTPKYNFISNVKKQFLTSVAKRNLGVSVKFIGIFIEAPITLANQTRHIEPFLKLFYKMLYKELLVNNSKLKYHTFYKLKTTQGKLISSNRSSSGPLS